MALADAYQMAVRSTWQSNEGEDMLGRTSRSLVVMMAMGLLVAACTVGSGNVETDTREVTGFDQIELQTSGSVDIEVTGTDSLVIEAEDNILPMLTAEVVNGVLELGSDGVFSSTESIRYTITVANLEGVTISGSGGVDATGLTGDTFAAVISGSGSLDAAGTTTEVAVVVSGSGSFDGEGLEATIGAVTITGSGSALVNVTDQLSVVISGSGSVEYLGEPTISQVINGSGNVSQR